MVNATNKLSVSIQKVREILLVAKNKLNADPKMKRILTITGISFAVIILILLGASVLKMIMQRPLTKIQITPTPLTTATPPSEILNPSRYATDSAVLALEEKVKVINQDASSLDIREYNLRPPTLDFDINFSK